jgi:hypothetical protein
MKPDDLEQILAQAAQRELLPDAQRAAIQRAQRTLLAGLRPAKPLASPRWFLLSFIAVCAGFAVSIAAILGMHGLHVLGAVQGAAIFTALLALAMLAAVACERAMRPAGGARLGWQAWLVAAIVFPVLFSLVFHGYSTLNFVHEGIPCLVAGLAVSLPTGLIVALILRRGFVMEWSSAGLAAGTLSGLAGLAMLELHCPNLKAIHVISWHVAVVVLAGILGWGIGWLADERRRKRTVTAAAAPGNA